MVFSLLTYVRSFCVTCSFVCSLLCWLHWLFNIAVRKKVSHLQLSCKNLGGGFNRGWLQLKISTIAFWKIHDISMLVATHTPGLFKFADLSKLEGSRPARTGFVIMPSSRRRATPGKRGVPAWSLGNPLGVYCVLGRLDPMSVMWV